MVQRTFLDHVFDAAGAGRHPAGHVVLVRRVDLLDPLRGQSLADQGHHHLHDLTHQLWGVAERLQPLNALPVHLVLPENNLQYIAVKVIYLIMK